IAIGTAKLFGIQLMTNFKTPYFSRDIAEFWRRWHISLSTWFRDYLYIPLGGSRVGKWKAVRNVFIIFLVSGFWHGANWTFIVWGGIHAALFLPLLLRGTNRRYTSDTIGEGRWLPTGREFLGMAWTFTMVCVAWVFFRAESVGEAVGYLERMAQSGEAVRKKGVVLVSTFLLVEYLVHSKFFGKFPQVIRAFCYSLAIAVILMSHFTHENQQFIYFQF
ncbi:MBOAT family protein, partial [Flavobacteriales bacterium]|nr:MBOAT family protein [Flavobacteriales bacterium]